jgi:hypothetical protein
VGAFAFAQLFLKEAKSGTLIFTGATMGIRGSANFSSESLLTLMIALFGYRGLQISHLLLLI